MEIPAKDMGGKSNYDTVLKATMLSRTLAFILFISLPFIGGYVGYVLHPADEIVIEKEVIKEVDAVKELEKVDIDHRNIYVSDMLKCTNDWITEPMSELKIGQFYGIFEYKGSHCINFSPNLGDQQVRSVTFYFESPTQVELKGKILGLDSGGQGLLILESEFEKLPSAILRSEIDPTVSGVGARRNDNRLNLGTGELLRSAIYDDKLDDIPVAYEKQTDVTIRLSDLRLKIDIGSMHGAYYLSSDSLEVVEYQEIDHSLDFSSVM